MPWTSPRCSFIVLGIVVYVVLYVLLPLIPLPGPFRPVITCIVWLIVAIVLLRTVFPIIPHVRI